MFATRKGLYVSRGGGVLTYVQGTRAKSHPQEMRRNRESTVIKKGGPKLVKRVHRISGKGCPCFNFDDGLMREEGARARRRGLKKKKGEPVRGGEKVAR